MATNKKNDQLTVNVQYIKDLSFESPNSPEALSNKDDTPSINVNVNVYAKPLKGNVYEVSLSINGKAEKKDFKVFEIELVYSGVFTLPKIKQLYNHYPNPITLLLYIPIILKNNPAVKSGVFFCL